MHADGGCDAVRWTRADRRPQPQLSMGQRCWPGALIDRGEIGRVGMIHALNFTDFLYRFRRPEELDTARRRRGTQPGGASGGRRAHARGGMLSKVRAATAQWDTTRPTEMPTARCSRSPTAPLPDLTYSGYGHFDSDEWMGWRGELRGRPNPQLTTVLRGADMRYWVMWLDGSQVGAQLWRQCLATGERVTRSASALWAGGGRGGERGDLRLTAEGVWVYGDCERRFENAPPAPNHPAPRGD